MLSAPLSTLSPLICVIQNSREHSTSETRQILPLQDDAVSVREAAVDLLGKHISSREDLALAYFDVLATAVRDPGTSVRKRAVNIMWESCVKQPGFPRATQACVHILTRATDPEDSIQKLVTKVFHNLWFSPTSSVGMHTFPHAHVHVDMHDDHCLEIEHSRCDVTDLLDLFCGPLCHPWFSQPDVCV